MLSMWSGLTGRQGYLVGFVLTLVLSLLLFWTLVFVGVSLMSWAFVFVVATIWKLCFLPCLLISVVLARRRLRDLGLSGVFVFVFFPHLRNVLYMVSDGGFPGRHLYYPVAVGSSWVFVAFTLLFVTRAGQLGGGPPSGKIYAVVRRLTECDSRASRLHFISLALPLLVISFIFRLRLEYFDRFPKIPHEVLNFAVTIEYFLLILCISVTVRRLHDFNACCFWAVLFPIGINNAISTMVSNPHGPIGRNLFEFLYVQHMVNDAVYYGAIGVLALIPGNMASNRYGPPPTGSRVTVDDSAT